MSGTAADLLREARKHLGKSGRPNQFTRWYVEQGYGTRDFLNAAWCDMFVSYVAAKSGNLKNVGGPFAYTVAHAQKLKDMGRWHRDDELRPGDIAFFDWDGTDSIARVDHVGIVEKVLPDGRVQTIEGNTADAVKRRIRSRSSIVGGGRPTFAGSPSKAPAKSKLMLRRGSRGAAVKDLQRALNRKGYKLVVDGIFGPKTEAAVKAFQRKVEIEVDGIVGPITWSKL